ncbi:hypothetical protein [Glycomyces tenuis]|uniref:hypothetical protein n=1 Tax=Glycomyces tenuis TaxID=58116 RepID=UPI000427D0AB|nr:hypothetical protein [Glycomyces tenuis]
MIENNDRSPKRRGTARFARVIAAGSLAVGIAAAGFGAPALADGDGTRVTGTDPDGTRVTGTDPDGTRVTSWDW